MEWISQKWHDFWPDKSRPIPVKGYWYGAPCVDPSSSPTFDPMLGFPNGRKERKVHVTLDEMIDAGVPPDHRNYCAHKYIDFMKCYRDTPVVSRVFRKACEPVWHHYAECRQELTVMQYKEFERERRLRARQKRRIAMGLETDRNEDSIAETI